MAVASEELRIALLTGPSGSGKTRLCASIVARCGRKGVPVAGVACPAVFEDGRKVGIDAVDLAGSLARVRLASIRAGFESARPGAFKGSRPAPIPDPARPDSFMYGMWSFDAAAFGALDDAAAGGIVGRAPIVIVDELGPLEMDHGVGFVRALAALDAAAMGRASDPNRPEATGGRIVLVTARPDISERLEVRWPCAVALGVDDRSEAEAVLSRLGF